MMDLSIEDIIEIYKEEKSNNPEVKITRDYFIKIVPKGIIDKKFGSFNNLKLKVGDIPTRTAFKEMKSYEKHKSVEGLKEYNKEKFSWANKFNFKDDKYRLKYITVVSDMHDLKCDPFYYRMFLNNIKNKPDMIVLNGDILDLPEFGKYSNKLSEFRIKDRISWLHKFLKDIRELCPDVLINYIEGNHEYRLIHHILEKSPMMEELIDFCGFNIRKLLGLDEFKVNYYSRADIGTFTEADINNELKKNHYIAYDNVVFYHYPEGRTRFGMPGVSGHHHKLQVWPMYNYTFGTYNWIQTGAGAIRNADFTDSSFCWQNGFAEVIVDVKNKKNLIMNNIDCTGEFCYMNGGIFQRNEHELKFMSNM
jgi:hypothetical protein